MQVDILKFRDIEVRVEIHDIGHDQKVMAVYMPNVGYSPADLAFIVLNFPVRRYADDHSLVGLIFDAPLVGWLHSIPYHIIAGSIVWVADYDHRLRCAVVTWSQDDDIPVGAPITIPRPSPLTQQETLEFCPSDDRDPLDCGIGSISAALPSSN